MATMSDFIELNDIASVTVTTQVNTVVRHIMNVVMAYDITIAKAKYDSGNILVEKSAVMYVIVQNLIVNRVFFFGPSQTDSEESGITDFIVLNEVMDVVKLKIDRVTPNRIKVVVFYNAVFGIF